MWQRHSCRCPQRALTSRLQPQPLSRDWLIEGTGRLILSVGSPVQSFPSVSSGCMACVLPANPPCHRPPMFLHPGILGEISVEVVRWRPLCGESLWVCHFVPPLGHLRLCCVVFFSPLSLLLKSEFCSPSASCILLIGSLLACSWHSPVQFLGDLMFCFWINFQGQKASTNILFSRMPIAQAITATTRICLYDGKMRKG